MSQWVRLWEDMPTDPKWRVIAKRSSRPVCEVVAVFVFMMTNAGASEARGELSSWDDEAVAMALDMEEASVTAIREAMQGRVLDGDHLRGWEKRQPKREDGSTGRVQAFRERKAETKRNETHRNACPKDETHRNAPEEKREDTEAERNLSLPITAPTKKREGGDLIECLESILAAYPPSKLHSQTKSLAAIQATSADDWPALIAGCAAYAIEFKAKPTTHPVALDRFIRERMFEALAPKSTGPPLVFVPVDSPDWPERVRAGHKPGLRTQHVVAGHSVEGWHFPASTTPKNGLQ